VAIAALRVRFSRLARGTEKEWRYIVSDCKFSFSGKTVIVFLVVGAAAGAAAVLLLVPNARRESTKRIRKLSQDLKERASDTIDTAREKLSSTVSRGKDYLDGKAAVFTSAVEAGKKAYERSEA